MRVGERSLRALVEKWLGLDAVKRARVTRFRRSVQHPWPYVRVEVTRPSGVLAIMFFRHDDGSWCVFPPEHRPPAINAMRAMLSASLG